MAVIPLKLKTLDCKLACTTFVSNYSNLFDKYIRVYFAIITITDAFSFTHNRWEYIHIFRMELAVVPFRRSSRVQSARVTSAKPKSCKRMKWRGGGAHPTRDRHRWLEATDLGRLRLQQRGGFMDAKSLLESASRRSEGSNPGALHELLECDRNKYSKCNSCEAHSPYSCDSGRRLRGPRASRHRISLFHLKTYYAATPHRSKC